MLVQTVISKMNGDFQSMLIYDNGCDNFVK